MVTKVEKDIVILAIESSCDETAAAVVKNGREVCSNIISTQIALHTLYGGVVPEIASRKHIEKINQVIEEALKESGYHLRQMDAIAVTYGPGLVGPLLVGVSAAKAISFATDIPLIGVHHIEGHISANYIENKDLEPPFICLVVSGGHSHLVVVKDYGEYEIIGRTRDDAAGEAFDKVARAIGLGYPGGPKIDKLVAKEGNPEAIHFPRAKVEDNAYDFSFSGLKSAVLNYLNSCQMKGFQYDHVVATAFETCKAFVRSSAGTFTRKDTGQVTGTITEQRHCLSVDGRQDHFADFTFFYRLQCDWIDNFYDYIIFPDMEPVLFRTFECDAGAVHLRHSETIVCFYA